MNLSETEAERIRAMGAQLSPAILAETREIFAGLVDASAPTEPDLRYGDDARQALDIYGAKLGAREVVIPGETGFLLPPEAIGPLAESLSQLAGDAALRTRLGTAGRSRFTEQFRHETMAAQLRALYERLLASPRNR